jgi:hypothetical protein
MTAKRSSKKKVGRIPGSILDLVERLSATHAFKLLEVRGGTVLHVPVVAAADHQLRKLIGDEGFELLVKEYAGEQLQLAKNDALARQLRHRYVQELRDQGDKIYQVALKTGYTSRHVINILQAGQTAPPQLGLFDDYEPAHYGAEVPTVSAHNPFGIISR